MNVIPYLKKYLATIFTSQTSFFETIVASKSYYTYPITQEKFHPISQSKISASKDEIRDIENEISEISERGKIGEIDNIGKIAQKKQSQTEQKIVLTKDIPFLFIDGGQNTIFLTSTLHFSLLRIAAIGLTKNHFTFLCVVTRNASVYDIDLIPYDEKAQQFIEKIKKESSIISNVEVFDSELRTGQQEVSPQQVTSFVRRLLELSTPLFFSDEHICVLDGTLETHHTFERKRITELCLQRTICSIAKTSSLVTQSGKPLPTYLLSQSPVMQSWILKDVLLDKEQVFETSFVKLHPKSKYVFRMDVSRKISSSVLSSSILSSFYTLDTIASALCALSFDAVFLGYPYPLIKADELARVSDREAQYLKTKLFSQLDILTRSQLEQLGLSSNAHDILDSIRF